MRKFIILSFAAAFAANAEFVKQATQPWVANRIGEARTAVSNEISAAVAAIPLPGDYAAVSNLAYQASATADDALIIANRLDTDYSRFKQQTAGALTVAGNRITANSNRIEAVAANIAPATNALARVAHTGDYGDLSNVPDIPEGMSPSAVTNIIHDLSLGGIWDRELQIWWTPVMIDGSLTYQATTNVDMNAASQSGAGAGGAGPGESGTVYGSLPPRRYALFLIDVNTTTNGPFAGFELKASTNNFSHAVDENTRLQYYAQGEIADTGRAGTASTLGIDKMRLYVGTSHGSEDVRAWTKIANTIDYPHHLTRVAVIVDAACLVRHPDGDWLREDNEELIWCYLRNLPLDPPHEKERGTNATLWRPVAPVRWFSRLPAWADQ